ncbi:MAG: MarR family EPS-associated transcriptional regulator [Deltaproteobacteria bacterium]|nr:MarR family EPS-associated transcriptional regulator [Deltaproteobacteria bacterium]
MSDPGESDLKDGELLKLLKELEASPLITQRELSSRLGISLGKVNYIVKAMINKGLIKANVFKKSNKKRTYFYILTPYGLEEKARVTYRFLKRKMREYDQLKKEIEQLKKETAARV